MPRMLIPLVLTLSACGGSRVLAHETWLWVSSYRPSPEERVTVCAGNGHAFPKSDMRIAPDWLRRLHVVENGIPRADLLLQPDGNEYTAAMTVERGGVFLFVLELQRASMSEPRAWVRAIMVSGERDEPDWYRTGDGLEIVPERAVSRLTEGESLPVAAYWKGERIENRLTIRLPKSGRELVLSTTPERPAVLTHLESGVYLLTVSYLGRTATLTFSIGGGRP